MQIVLTNLLLVLFSCTRDHPDCSGIDTPSVVVSLDTEDGIDNPSLFFTVDDLESQPAEEYEDAQWVAGWNLSGNINIMVEANICPSAPDCICVAQKEINILVPTTKRGCIETQQVTIYLEESDIVEQTCLE